MEAYKTKKMGYKWKPNKAQRREFAERMNNPEEKEAYEQRKSEKAEKRRKNSKFDYESAGGSFVPTLHQYESALTFMGTVLTDEQENACQLIIMAYTNNDKTHHDNIHVINEMIRGGHK